MGRFDVKMKGERYERGKKECQRGTAMDNYLCGMWSKVSRHNEPAMEGAISPEMRDESMYWSKESGASRNDMINFELRSG